MTVLREIENAQAKVTQGEAVVNVNAPVIWSAMVHQVEHGTRAVDQTFGARRDYSSDPAH
jgi:hypothetical protein